MIAVTGVWGLHGRSRRVENYERFAAGLAAQGVQLATVELAFDGEPTYAYGDHVTWMRGDRRRHDLFQKEALCNRAIRTWAEGHDVVCWVDADVLFMNPHWADDARRELEHHDVVQLFSTTRYCTGWWDLGPEIASAGKRWSTRDQRFDDLGQTHPGLAWAARGEWIRERGLYAGMASGSNDTVMWKAFTGGMARLRHQDKMSAAFRDHASEYCARCEDARAGYVEGCAVHLNHGDLRARDYEARWDMPWYDPRRDVVTEESGLLAWASDGAREKFEATRLLLRGT